jgi:asparagine synthase (glutamine-hydrolysing)
MCGIAGFQGDFDRELLDAMTRAVAHRGPDGSGATVITGHGQPPTGLGHRRLAIIDLSDAGLQPMTIGPDAAGGMQTGLTLIYNGEIYNYRELRAELVAQGHHIRSASDSEVLLHLYESAGLDMLGRLNGIFAFAIHDAREHGRPPGVDRGAVFVARDHMGIKPLYYAELPRGLLFGSEIKAILQEESVPRDVDFTALHENLAYLWTPAPRTILRAVRKLEPGSAMLVSGGRVRRRWSYYQPPHDGTRSSASESEVASELATRLQTAVRRQLVADVPVGAFLSGGLDSSAVVAMMRRELPEQPITCFSIGFPGSTDPDVDAADLPFARKVAAHLGVQLQEIHLEASMIRRLEELVGILDEPQADPAPINALIISEQARAMGIPVLLSGAGGDDLFGGYRRHWALQFERSWSWLPQVARQGLENAARWAGGGALGGQSSPALRRLSKMFSHAGDTADRRMVSYFYWSTESLRTALYSRALQAETANVDTAAPLLESLARIPRERDPLQRMLFLEQRHFLADHNLNYTDRAGMAVAVEVRVPLLDVDLVEFAARVPSGMKQRGRVGKAIFKRAMEPFLPKDVIYRPKTGFGVPLRRWLRTELREMVGDILSPDAVRQRGFFDPHAVAKLIEMDRRGSVDGAYTIFALLTLELWCRSFLDPVPASVPAHA